MVLDIGIHTKGNAKDPLERDLVVSLEEVDLAYLGWVFIVVHEKTGIEITSYDDARLQGQQLELLDGLLCKAICDIKSKPNKWNEYIGFQLKPRKKLYSPIIKSELLAKVNRLRELVFRSQSNEEALFFFGD